MQDIVFAKDLENIGLGAPAPKPTTLTAGQMEAFVRLWASEGEIVKSGVWECTPGRFTADRRTNSEICYIISGKVEMRNAAGELRQLGPGDCLILPMGWVGEWNILETTRKFYVTYAPSA